MFTLGRNLCRRQFCSGEKKRDPVSERVNVEKGAQWMVVVDGAGIPLGNYLDSAFPSEFTLIEPTLERVGVPQANRDGRGKFVALEL